MSRSSKLCTFFFQVFLLSIRGHPSFKLLFLLLFLAKGWGNWSSELLNFFSIFVAWKQAWSIYFFVGHFYPFFVILTLSREEGASSFSCFNVSLLMLVGAKEFAPSFAPFFCHCYLQRGDELQVFFFFPPSSCVVVFSLLFFLFLFFSFLYVVVLLITRGSPCFLFGCFYCL